jgi:hypothetical protein
MGGIVVDLLTSTTNLSTMLMAEANSNEERHFDSCGSLWLDHIVVSALVRNILVETLPQEAQVWQTLRHKNKTPKFNLSMVLGASISRRSGLGGPALARQGD